MSQLQVTGEAKVRDIQGPVVANSGVITALDGDASQYVRGDGTLADFPTSTGGGSSVSYYLNSSVSQGTIGGVAYRQLSKTPIAGAGTDISASTNGYIASYLTDANDPALLEVPAGNFNCEFYFSVNSDAHNPYVYAELYKYDGTTFTLLGSNVAIPEYLTNGTTLSAYYFAIPVAVAALTVTDRIAIRIYVNVDGRTVTLHTENNHLCQVVTTFSKGLISLNNLTRQNQFFATGTSGTDFNISSTTATHTFNLPVASATNTGKLSSTDWSTFNGKVPYTGAIANVDLGNFNFDANNISGGAIIAKLNGPASSPFVLKSGSSGYTIGDDAISLVSSPTTANTLILASNIGVVTKTAQIGLGSLSATRTFTLPDITGTLALTSDLSAYLPLTGGTLTGALIGTTATFSGTVSSIVTSGGTSFRVVNSVNSRAWSLVPSTNGAESDLWLYYGGTGTGTKVAFVNNGNVLIGSTTDSGELLQVNGTSKFTGALSGTSATFSGNVNIGPTSAGFDSVSQIASSSTGNIINALTLQNTSNTETAGTGVNLNFGGKTNWLGRISTQFVGTTGGGDASMSFLTPSGGTLQTRLTIASTGAATFSSSVTIGTNLASGTALAISNTTNARQFQFGYSTGAGYNYFQVYDGTSFQALVLNNALTLASTGAATFSSSVTAPTITIGSLGSGSNAVLTLATNASGAPRTIYYKASDATLNFTGTGGTDLMTITNGGNVLVGTTSSIEGKLQVSQSGDVWNTEILHSYSTQYFMVFRYNGTAIGSIIGNGSSTAFNTTSDYRLKQDLKEFSGLDLISKIKTYDYQWKSNNSRMYGVLAHELQEVVPYAVCGKKDDLDKKGNINPQGVDYSKIVPIMVKAIQELKLEIEQLKNK